MTPPTSAWFASGGERSAARAHVQPTLNHPRTLPRSAVDVRKNVGVDLALIDALDDQVRDLELHLVRGTRRP